MWLDNDFILVLDPTFNLSGQFYCNTIITKINTNQSNNERSSKIITNCKVLTIRLKISITSKFVQTLEKYQFTERFRIFLSELIREYKVNHPWRNERSFGTRRAWYARWNSMSEGRETIGQRGRKRRNLKVLLRKRFVSWNFRSGINNTADIVLPR